MAAVTQTRPTYAPAVPRWRRPRPNWWPDLLASGAVLSLLIVTALWLRDGGLQQLATDGWTGATALGRITGLLSADLLLIQVLMMARVPWIDRAYGQDRLARVHRPPGLTSCN